MIAPDGNTVALHLVDNSIYTLMSQSVRPLSRDCCVLLCYCLLLHQRSMVAHYCLCSTEQRHTQSVETGSIHTTNAISNYLRSDCKRATRFQSGSAQINVVPEKTTSEFKVKTSGPSPRSCPGTRTNTLSVKGERGRKRR